MSVSKKRNRAVKPGQAWLKSHPSLILPTVAAQPFPPPPSNVLSPEHYYYYYHYYYFYNRLSHYDLKGISNF